MKDIRLDAIAKQVCDYSFELKKGEKVVIYGAPQTMPLIKALMEAVYARGAYPIVHTVDPEVAKLKLMHDSKEMMEIDVAIQDQLTKHADCYIRIGYSENDYENSEIPAEQTAQYMELMRPVTTWRVNNTRWMVMRYPSPANAQSARMSFEKYEDLVFNATSFDYSTMKGAMQKLKDMMDKTDKVRLVGPNTDLAFSIKDIPAIVCAGEMNLPDGEVYTSPVKDSVNGVLTYNTTSLYNGTLFENVSFTFKDGKIVEATALQGGDKLDAILNTDEGARFIGEFAIGVNPMISDAVGNILFDEKIHGSFHFTPGNAYEDADNTNRSAVHWDLVCIQRPEYGGGEMYFDDVLVRKDGRFVVPELECLNPENLI